MSLLQRDFLPIFSLADYQKMFALEEHDLQKTFLDYGAGASSFNAEMHAHGYSVVSADPLYEYALEEMTHQLSRFPQQAIADVFIRDFLVGTEQRRYCTEVLPHLSFRGQQFEMGLCLYALFNLPTSLEETLNNLHDLCRVSYETRIYPLLDPQGNISPLLGPVMLTLQNQNYGVEVKQVSFELQKGGNAMLRIWPQTCEVTP